MTKSKMVMLGIATVLCLSTANLYATTIDNLAVGFNKLTELQKTELLQRAAIMSSSNALIKSNEATRSDSVVTTVDKYAEIGIKIGKALAGGAQELGVEANKFLSTPAGQWTLAIIVYKTMGSDLMLLLAAVLVLITGITYVGWMSRRMVDTNIKYNVEKTNIFGNHPIQSVERAHLHDDDVGVLTFIVGACLASFVVLMICIG